MATAPLIPPQLAPSTAIPCRNVLKKCLPCDDDPVANFTAEGADSDRFLFIFRAHIDAPLGWDVGSPDATSFCWSTVSIDDAEDCAREDAENKVTETIRDPGGNPPTLFLNTPQSCTATCSDGTPFVYTVPAGTVFGFTQFEANYRAHGLACERARTQSICFLTTDLAPGCVGSNYSMTLSAIGGTRFAVNVFNIIYFPSECFSQLHVGDTFPYLWSISSGSLPPGLSLHPCTGIIDGTPTTSGTYTFRVFIVDAVGSFQTKLFTICIAQITTASPLPDATIGTPYSKQLVESPGVVASEVWSVVSGSLPPGLMLSPSGLLSGTPTGSPASYHFTIQVVAFC